MPVSRRTSSLSGTALQSTHSIAGQNPSCHSAVSSMTTSSGQHMRNLSNFVSAGHTGALARTQMHLSLSNTRANFCPPCTLRQPAQHTKTHDRHSPLASASGSEAAGAAAKRASRISAGTAAPTAATAATVASLCCRRNAACSSPRDHWAQCTCNGPNGPSITQLSTKGWPSASTGGGAGGGGRGVVVVRRMGHLDRMALPRRT